jgi:hydroxymethylglutaryl-CoA lyase
MQGIKPFIPTERKVAIQSLLRIWLWLWEFCVPKAIPQMQDTAAVLGQLDLSQKK